MAFGILGYIAQNGTPGRIISIVFLGCAVNELKK
jgi:hypothetical protein